MPSSSASSASHRRLAVQRADGQFRVVAETAFAAGDVLLLVNGLVVDRPSRYSVQIGPHAHVDPPVAGDLTLDIERYPWRFLNHACEPNAALQGRTLVARRWIRPGEEVTFDYLTTEYDLAEPFSCSCGAPSCRGVIRGFRHLTPAQQRALWPELAPHLRALAAEPTPNR